MILIKVIFRVTKTKIKVVHETETATEMPRHFRRLMKLSKNATNGLKELYMIYIENPNVSVKND